MKTFEEIGVEQNILKAIEELGFDAPMPVQEQVIPYLINDNSQDVIALAQTGTGKTAAFGLPIIQRIDTSLNKIQYLIISPTRELCLQIADDLAGYAKYKEKIKIAAVFGGSSIERQIQMIKKGVHVISATPGRLIDLINRGIVDLTKIKTVVLDEADEMLNMGFRDDIEEILSKTPSSRSTLLFSATMPAEVRQIANHYMNEPVEVTIGKKNAGAENVSHVCYLVHAKDRYLALKRIVDYYPEVYGIIFCRTRKETQEIADLLLKDGYNADALHGDLSQAQRDTVMNKFRIRHLKLLVATDVAARGLDVDDLTHVINFNLPDELEVYTHRSGRTGRAGKAGISIIITNLREKSKIQQIEKQINKKFKIEPVPNGKEICTKQLFYLIDRMEKVEVDDRQIDAFLPDIYRKLEWLDRNELIKKFVSMEFNRFLDYYKNAPDLNAPVENKRSKKERNSSGQFARFFINLGRTDDLNPQTLIGMVNDFTGIRNIEIGEIEILKNFSFFEADSSYTNEILETFQGQKLRKREINIEIAADKRGRDRNKSFKSKKEFGKKEFGKKEFHSRDKKKDRPKRDSEKRSDKKKRGK